MQGFSGFSIRPPSDRVKIGKRLSPSEVHVDRLSTAFLHAYMQSESNFVASRVFPVVPSDRQSNYYPQYPKAYWFKSQLGVRGPGSVSNPVELTTDNSGTYFCDVIAGHVPIDQQTQSNADVPYDPMADATRFLAAQALLWKEIDWASKYFVTSVWGTSATVSPLWSASNSTPLADIETGMYTVQKNTGYRPNKFIMGAHTWRILKNHSDVVGRLNYGQTPGGPAIASLESLARLIGVDECLVMGAVKNTADLGQTATMGFVGDTHALLVYAPPNPGRLIPSGGYTFAWNGYLGANASGGRITTWYEPSRKSDVVEIELAVQHKLIASDLGYAFISCVS